VHAKHACLSFVAFALDSGDEREIQRWITRIAPELWAEGSSCPSAWRSSEREHKG